MQATSSRLLLVWKGKPCFVLISFFRFDFVSSLRACSLQLNFTHLLKQGPFLLMGHPVIIRQQNQMLLDCMHVYVIYLYEHLVLSTLSAISSSLRRGGGGVSGLYSRQYLHSQISRTRLFWGLQICPLPQNMDFNVLFTYHQVKFCVSFSFKHVCLKENAKCKTWGKWKMQNIIKRYLNMCVHKGGKYKTYYTHTHCLSGTHSLEFILLIAYQCHLFGLFFHY